MSAVTATQMKYASSEGTRTRDATPIAGIISLLLLLQETGVTLAQRRRWWTSDSAFVHLCNLSGLLDLVILTRTSTRRK
jgi:hypothetical protein